MDQSLLASIRNFKKTELSEAETVDKSVPEGVVPQTHLASTSTTSSRPSRSTIKSRSHARVASSDSLFGGSSNGRSGSDDDDEEQEQEQEQDGKPNFADLRKPTISRPAGNSSLFTDISDEITRELMIGFVEQLKSGKPLNVIMMVMRSRLPDERLHERVLQAAGMSSSSTSTSVPTSPASSAGSATSPKSKRKKEKRKKEKRSKNNASSDEHEMTSTRRPPTSPGPQDRVSDIESILGTQRQIKKAEKKSHIPPPLIHTPIKQGWMNKQSRYLKQWRCRWFVLQGDTLYTFKSQHVLEKPTETISLKTYNSFQPITDISMPINAMELSSKEQPKLRIFTIDPLNEPSKDEWIRALEKAMKKAART